MKNVWTDTWKKNKWVNEWMKEWMNEWFNERCLYEWEEILDKLLNQWLDECFGIKGIKQMNEWLN